MYENKIDYCFNRAIIAIERVTNLLFFKGFTMKKLVFESELLKETRALMKSRSHTTTIGIISKDTTLDKNWLYSFENGKCEDPGVARVETLNNYLKKVKNG